MSGHFEIEADRDYSSHTGMVFGNYVNDADRKPRVRQWRVLRDGKTVMHFRTKREALAYVKRQTK